VLNSWNVRCGFKSQISLQLEIKEEVFRCFEIIAIYFSLICIVNVGGFCLVARFDFSWQSDEYHQETLENLKKAIKNTKKLCAVSLQIAPFRKDIFSFHEDATHYLTI
jgi:hypothetical protein